MTVLSCLADLPVERLDPATNGFLLVSAALVLLMTPALGLFYAGFVRGRNVLNTLMMSFSAMALVGVLWIVVGYSLAFSKGVGPLAPFIGGLAWAGLSWPGQAMRIPDVLS